MSSIHKTKARKTVVDGIEFPSAAEAKRYGELRLMERAGEISNLITQPRFCIFEAGAVAIHYTADFSYALGKEWIVEEVKGMADTAYMLRRKMFVALFPFTPLYEIRGGKRFRVFLTKGGLCKTHAEHAPPRGAPRRAKAKARRGADK